MFKKILKIIILLFVIFLWIIPFKTVFVFLNKRVISPRFQPIFTSFFLSRESDQAYMIKNIDDLTELMIRGDDIFRFFHFTSIESTHMLYIILSDFI